MGSFVRAAFKCACLAKLRLDASSWPNVSSKFEGKMVTYNIQTCVVYIGKKNTQPNKKPHIGGHDSIEYRLVQ